MTKLSEFLSPLEAKVLLKTSNFQGWLAVFTTWGLIAGSFAMVAWWPNILTIVLATLILGGRHLALAILMHDASHYSLFKSRKLNDFVGGWLCAFPTAQDLRRYRAHHMQHHIKAGSKEDPDWDLVRPFPVSPASLRRKFLRDIFGISGVKRAYGIFLMDAGFIEYTVSSAVRRIEDPNRKIFVNLLRNSGPAVLCNITLFGILWACHHPELFLLWIFSYLTTFSLFVRVRSLAEHACTEMDLDPMKSTRTTYANIFARLSVAPHHVNYHLEHHLLMGMPSHNLARLHRLLRDRGALAHANIAHGYFEVLRAVVS